MIGEDGLHALMPKFRSKPVVIEAVQFDPYDKHKMRLPDGVTGVPGGGADNWAYMGCTFFVTTTHGQRTDVVAGDWIIRDPDGNGYYPCKPDIFEATYEAVG